MICPHIALDRKMTVNDGKDVAHFKVLTKNLFVGAEENHEKISQGSQHLG
jgi:hypothetical protein